MPDRMVREAARFSSRVESVSQGAELMFWRLLTVPDDYGIYHADANLLRSAIWPKNPRNIRVTDITRWRDELVQAGMLAIFEHEGKAYIEVCNFGQKLKFPKRKYPPAPGGVRKPAAMPTPTPPEVTQEEERREEKGGGNQNASRQAAGSPAPAIFSSPDSQSDESWVAQLQTQWPDLDVRRQLTLAHEDRRKRGKDLERTWFAQHWLPKVSPILRVSAALPPTPSIGPEPTGWRAWLADRYPGESWALSAATYEWTSLTPTYRGKIEREMREPCRSA